LGLTNVLFDELEVLNVSNESVSVLISIVENLFSGSTWDGNLQELPGIVTKNFKLLKSHLSLSSFGHFSISVHDLETHLSAMSLEKEVGLNKIDKLPII